MRHGSRTTQYLYSVPKQSQIGTPPLTVTFVEILVTPAVHTQGFDTVTSRIVFCETQLSCKKTTALTAVEITEIKHITHFLYIDIAVSSSCKNMRVKFFIFLRCLLYRQYYMHQLVMQHKLKLTQKQRLLVMLLEPMRQNKLKLTQKRCLL